MNRIVYKIFFTSFSFLISTCVVILVARNLGAENYGKISYIFATYDFLIQIFTLMIPTAYVFFLSEKKYNRSDLNFFMSAYLGLVSIAVLVITILTINNDNGRAYLWGDINSPLLIFCSFVIVSAINIQNILLNFSDATLQTIKSENSKFLSKLFLFVLLLMFIYFEILVIDTYLLMLGLSLIVFFITYSRLIKFDFIIPNRVIFLDMLKDFIMYVKPLLAFTFVAVIYIYLGKYVLQQTSGSIEQGYFALAFQVSMLPVIIISPIMPIIMREITEKYDINNTLEVKTIFLDRFFRILPLYGLASIFLIFNSEEVILFTTGKDFLGAKYSIEVLSIYSFLHVFGLFNSTMYLSTGRNKEYGIITVITLIIGSLYLIYKFFNGTLNSSGLATVLVVIYFFQTFWLLILNMKFLDINKIEFFIEFVKVLSIVLLIVFLTYNLNLHILFNVLACVFTGLVLNFVFKDYLALKNIYKSFYITRS